MIGVSELIFAASLSHLLPTLPIVGPPRCRIMFHGGVEC